ncbi:hypothetical protein TSUD_365540 [Trifolium subterraneum]|uniref:Uncharacterized protein n=1 Tax=Trifolium subterraneum TaxID=3900 RepID=A0A2Z6MDP5_TRISU|nr:hypothetical protein TSUD_365540 [Trifolium subterraneum]
MRRADEAKFARAGDIDVKIETLKNEVANLEKKLASEKEKLATVIKEKNDLAAKYKIRIIAPNVEVSKVDKYKVVRDGMIVDEEEDQET